MKKIGPYLKFVFENAPNYGFWLGVLIFLRDWYVHQHIIVKLLFIVIPIFFIIKIFAAKAEKLKRDLNEMRIVDTLKKETRKEPDSKLKALIRSIPTEKSLKLYHEYAENYANTWASDGKVDEVNYYIDLNGHTLRKDVQIYLSSRIRSETLTLYLPKKSERIEERGKDVSTCEVSLGSAPIHTFSNFCTAIRRTMENSAADIEKAESVHIQISPTVKDLHINFSFALNNRNWRKLFLLQDNKLFLNRNLICEFQYE